MITILAILITIVNILRYNLPDYIHDISVFDTLSLVALGLTILTALGKDKNVLTKGLLVFNLLGCVDSLVDELWSDPTFVGVSDLKTLIATVTITIIYMVYRIKIKDEPLL